MRTLICCTLLLFAAACDAPTDASPVLRFTAIPGEDPTRMQEKFTPVARYLAETLGVEVEYVHASGYTASVETFKNGDVQLAWFGGLTGVKARSAVLGARAIAQGVEDPEYRSYFIAHADSGIEASDSFPTTLAGKSFTFGDKTSTSGRLMPEHFIRAQTGMTPGQFFGADPQFSGSHDLTCEKVEKGVVQAGAVSYTTYDRRVKEGATDPARCRIVWTTPSYPDYNFTAHPDLEQMFGVGFIDRLQAALIAMEGEHLLGGFQRSGMIAADNADFVRIETLAHDLGMLR